MNQQSINHVATVLQKKPELLSPAGSLEKQDYALAYGADAVYAGAPQFSLRARENAFSEEDVFAGVAKAHAAGKHFYLTVNLLAHNRKIKPFLASLERLLPAKPDALIMADPGLIDLVRQKHPEVKIHLSVQANTMNWAAARFWHKQGVTRVILSREIALEEIAEIKANAPEMEIEVFVHGALCVAHSGRCLLSNYFSYRDANTGCCTNACRWPYRLYYLEETSRSGELMPIDEDEHGTYIMNARDLMAMEFLEPLVRAGVDSLKIEGRNKSIFYVSVVTRAYRKALDAIAKGLVPDPGLIADLYKIHNRGYTAGFLANRADQTNQRYDEGRTDQHEQEFAARVLAFEDGQVLLEPKNRLCVGDHIEIITPTGSYHETVRVLTLVDGTAVSAVHAGANTVARMPVSAPDIPAFSLISRILA